MQPKTAEQPLVTISPDKHWVQTVVEVHSMHPDIRFPQKEQLDTVAEEYSIILYLLQRVQKVARVQFKQLVMTDEHRTHLLSFRMMFGLTMQAVQMVELKQFVQ